MEWFAKAFIKMSLLWLSIGVTLGVAMAVYPPWVAYRPAHLHMLVLGFVTMMINGVAYHVLPRFVGAPLASRRIPVLHLLMSNTGLSLMAAGFILRANSVSSGSMVLASGGVLSAAGAYAFAYVLWRTMSAGASRQATVTLQRVSTGNS